MRKLLRLLFKIVCWCSGARLYLLEKCPSEHNTYFGIGLIVLLTGIMAGLSGSYAFFTIFGSVTLSVVFGLFWGVLIFSLDWYLVASLRKQEVKMKEIRVAAPRLILAVLLGIVISKPLELKLFEKEINDQIELQRISDAIKSNKSIGMEFGEIDKLKQENEMMATQLKSKEMERNQLLKMVIDEAEGQSPTGKMGKGPVYAEKKQAYAQSERELKDLNAQFLPLIKANSKRVEQLLASRDLRVESKRASSSANNGFLARINAINTLSSQNTGIMIINWFIVLLFICIESAPMIVKLMSHRGPYDDFLDAENLSKSLAAKRLIYELEMTQNKDYSVSFEKNKLEYSRAIESNADFIERVTRAQVEINEKIVEKWKQQELEQIETNFKKYIPMIENTLKGNKADKSVIDPHSISQNDGSSK